MLQRPVDAGDPARAFQHMEEGIHLAAAVRHQLHVVGHQGAHRRAVALAGGLGEFRQQFAVRIPGHRETGEFLPQPLICDKRRLTSSKMPSPITLWLTDFDRLIIALSELGASEKKGRRAVLDMMTSLVDG